MANLSAKFLWSILVMLVLFVYKEELQKKNHAVDEFIDDVPLPMWFFRYPCFFFPGACFKAEHEELDQMMSKLLWCPRVQSKSNGHVVAVVLPTAFCWWNRKMVKFKVAWAKSQEIIVMSKIRSCCTTHMQMSLVQRSLLVHAER